MLIFDIKNSCSLLISYQEIKILTSKTFLISKIQFLDFRTFFMQKKFICILGYQKIYFFNIRK